VTDPFIAQSGMLEPIKAALTEAGTSFSVFDQCVPDPTTETIAAGLAAWEAAGQPDCLVGVGGGSSIDSAKAMAILAGVDRPLRDFKMPAQPEPGLPVIAIPTTAGTGSEVTRASIVTDVETNEKMLCMGRGLMPTIALVDYELTLSMPFRLTADSALDSLCHAMEAYVSRRANPFSDTHALAAMRAIPANLRAVRARGDDRAAREALMVASTQAGLAFSNSSVTLIHGMSRPIGAFFHVPHGMSNAMLLPAITAFSVPGAPVRYAQCARAMGFATGADGDDAAVALLLRGLRELTREMAVPSLRAFGVDEAEFFANVPTMAAQALASGSPNNNPQIPSQSEVEALYAEVFAETMGAEAQARAAGA
tara:strand:- start:220 stop:1317 length:1098 start_codon:yes stop_codon:yes gene_type:complete